MISRYGPFEKCQNAQTAELLAIPPFIKQALTTRNDSFAQKFFLILFLSRKRITACVPSAAVPAAAVLTAGVIRPVVVVMVAAAHVGVIAQLSPEQGLHRLVSPAGYAAV